MKSSDKRRSPVGRCSDVGRVRSVNEDCMGDLPINNGYVLIVADGMGGYRGGALASQLAVEAIQEYFRDAVIEHPRKALRQAIHLANERIYLRGQQDKELSRMGSTCVLAIVLNDELSIAHVGDSRIYLARKGEGVKQLTRDHTVVQHFVDVGLLTQEEAEVHPDSHILSRALGPRAHVEPEVAQEPVRLQAGDRVVLCSDGLTKMVSDSKIHQFVSRSANSQSMAEFLVATANRNGGEDNVTVVVYEYIPEGYFPAPEETLAWSGELDGVRSDIDPLGDTPPFSLEAATPPLEEKEEVPQADPTNAFRAREESSVEPNSLEEEEGESDNAELYGSQSSLEIPKQMPENTYEHKSGDPLFHLGDVGEKRTVTNSFSVMDPTQVKVHEELPEASRQAQEGDAPQTTSSFATITSSVLLQEEVAEQPSESPTHNKTNISSQSSHVKPKKDES